MPTNITKRRPARKPSSVRPKANPAPLSDDDADALVVRKRLKASAHKAIPLAKVLKEFGYEVER